MYDLLKNMCVVHVIRAGHNYCVALCEMDCVWTILGRNKDNNWKLRFWKCEAHCDRIGCSGPRPAQPVITVCI